MKKYLLSGIVIAAAVGGIWWWSAQPTTPNALDPFAQCLAEKGVIMYGADWCAHCQKEKKEFGSAFKYVPYVECPRDPKKCMEKGVDGYPTWILDNGKKLVGEQGLEKLARESGCLLPSDSN